MNNLDEENPIGNKVILTAVLFGAFLIAIAAFAGHPANSSSPAAAAIRGVYDAPLSFEAASAPEEKHWTGNGIDLVTRDEDYSNCRHLMEERGLRDGWTPAALALGGSPPVRGCMHVYEKYDRTWDNNQYSDRVFGFCPIDGGTLIEECLTIPPLREAE